jgi:hypothetical protein
MPVLGRDVAGTGVQVCRYFSSVSLELAATALVLVLAGAGVRQSLELGYR